MNDGFEYIRRLCDHAVEGPWSVVDISCMGYHNLYGVSDGGGGYIIPPEEENSPYNMEFVAASRELIPKLLDAAKVLDTIVQNYKAMRNFHGFLDQAINFGVAEEILDKLRRYGDCTGVVSSVDKEKGHIVISSPQDAK